MFIKRLFLSFILIFTLVACTHQSDWYGEYGDIPITGNPSQMQSNFNYPEYGIYGDGDSMYTTAPISDQKNVAVLLPLSGPQADLGRGISTSMEIAFMQRQNNKISVTFYDMSGNKNQKHDTVVNVLASQPDIILGPVFAEDAQMVRDMKPDDMPVLSFTSDDLAVGNGVMTMALIPAQSVEMIIREMARDGARSFVIVAPKTQSGERMAGAAVQTANLYDMPLSGLFYYTEGNSDSIKQAANRASMFDARSAANTKAREILSDILVKEIIPQVQRSSINRQLDKISKSDTLGKVPYDAILFLGGANDTKTVASFLRYFDVSPRDVRFYGTALWDSSDLAGDLNMAGAKFAAMPTISENFEKLYQQLSGERPTRLDAFGFDAANLTVGMFYSNKYPAAYLLDPSGYNGLDGLFRLRPSGISERALQIVEFDGSGATRTARPAATDFLTPPYNVDARKITRAAPMDLVGPGVNPMDYISIPENLRGKYWSKTFGANTRVDTDTPAAQFEEVVILPEDDSDIIETPDFQPTRLDTVDRHLIDSVEVN